MAKKPNQQPAASHTAPPNVQVCEGSTAQLPITVVIPELVRQNDTVIAKVVRRFRELVLDAQRHHGTGYVRLAVEMRDGLCTNKKRVHPDWDEVD